MISRIILFGFGVIICSSALFFYLANRKLHRVISQHRYQLDTSEKKFRKLANNLPKIAIKGFTIERDIFFWNKASERLYGYTEKEALGRKLEDLIIPGAMKDHFREAVSRWVNLDFPIESSQRILQHKDGRPLYVHSSHVMFEEQPNGKEMYCIDMDVTSIQQAEEERKKAEDRIRYQASLLDHVRNCVYVTTNGGTIQYWNQYAAKTYQYSATEATGRSLIELIIPQQSMKKLQKSALLRKKHGKWEGEVLHKRKDGSLFSAYTAETSIKDDSGSTVAILGISIDMTERNDLLKQLQQSQKMETIGTLAGGIAHDFNNILGAIIGYTEMAEDEIPDSTPGKENIPEILQASNRAKDLVKQILTFSRKSERLQISGDDLTLALHDIRPDLPVILCTGYNYLMDKEMATTTGIHTCLTKPVSKKDLATAVRAALDSVLKTPLVSSKS